MLRHFLTKKKKSNMGAGKEGRERSTCAIQPQPAGTALPSIPLSCTQVNLQSLLLNPAPLTAVPLLAPLQGNLQDAASQLPGLHDQTTLDNDVV